MTTETTRELIELSGDGCWFYEVHEHSKCEQLSAAERALEGHIGVSAANAPQTVAWLAAKADARTMREHVEPPESCGCEAEGWWCESGDGQEQRLFYAFETSDIFGTAETMAHDEAGEA